MQTSMLESTNSPTQKRTPTAFQLSQFTGEVLGDADIEHEIEITYEWSNHAGAWLSGISVWSFDYQPNALPGLSDRDLCEAVKDFIRQEANCTVTFY